MTQNKNLLPTIGALGLGASLMYLMDPEMGRRRRAMMRDKFVHLEHETGDFMSGQARNLKNHAVGWMHEAKGRFHRADDQTMTGDASPAGTMSTDAGMSGSMSEPLDEATGAGLGTMSTDFTPND